MYPTLTRQEKDKVKRMKSLIAIFEADRKRYLNWIVKYPAKNQWLIYELLENADKELSTLKKKVDIILDVRRDTFNIDACKAVNIENVLNHFGIKIHGRSQNRLFIKLRDERTASCSVYLHNNTFYDFGSGESGDNIDLVMRLDGCTLREACELLQKL